MLEKERGQFVEKNVFNFGHTVGEVYKTSRWKMYIDYQGNYKWERMLRSGVRAGDIGREIISVEE